MCLYARKGAIVKIAKGNITVYKRLEWIGKQGSVNLYRPPYQRNFEYLVGVLAKVRVRWGIAPGFVKKGLHAYTTKNRAFFTKYGREVVFSSTIPKGSKYILGRNGDIVSNQLIIRKKCTKK